MEDAKLSNNDIEALKINHEGVTDSDSDSETDGDNKEHEKELRKYKDERKLSNDGRCGKDENIDCCT